MPPLSTSNGKSWFAVLTHPMGGIRFCFLVILAVFTEIEIQLQDFKTLHIPKIYKDPLESLGLDHFFPTALTRYRAIDAMPFNIFIIQAR